MTMRVSMLNDMLDAASSTNVFNQAELDILQEVIREYEKEPECDYYLITLEEEKVLKGFLIYGKTPLTENTWDLYWLVVEPLFQRKGIGRKLIKLFEHKILLESLSGSAVVRVETSSRAEYDGARQLYEKTGYSVSGIIENFYKENDDLVIFSKHVLPVS